MAKPTPAKQKNGYFAASMRIAVYKYFVLFLMLFTAFSIQAQLLDTSACFEAVILNAGQKHSTPEALSLTEDISVYYRTEDHYTFWYRFITAEKAIVSFELWPTQPDDTYHFLLFEEQGPQFCEHLVAGNAPALDAPFSFETGIAGENHLFGVSSTFEMPANSSYYLAVLNMTDGGCGHRLVLHSNSAPQTINAIHQPCFSFQPIMDWISFEPEVIIEDDITLVLPVDENELEILDQHNEPEIEAIDAIALPEENDETMPLEVVSGSNTEQELEQMTTLRAEKTALKELPNVPVTASALAFELEAANKIELREIYFHNNTYAFTKQSNNQLNDLYELMRSRPELNIIIHGHTSGNTRSIRPDPNTIHLGEGWNFKGNSRQLSKKRAEAVKRYLVQRGIEAGRMKTEGHADDMKIIENPNTPQDHMRNMRVEITVAP